MLEPRLVLALQLDIGISAIAESGGIAVATISRTGSLSSPLTVALSSSDVTEATVPTSVLLGVNQASTNFNVTAVNDSLADDTQTVTITASASGFADATDTIDVLNDDLVTSRAGAASDTVNVLPGLQAGETDITAGPATPPSIGDPTYFSFANQTTYQTAGANVQAQSSDFFAVDITKTYALNGFAKSGDEFGERFDPTNEQSFGLSAYDADLLPILPQNVLRFDNAVDTTLAAPLHPGDTLIHLASAAGWSNAAGTASGTRGLAWYGYQASAGTTYADYTYTRNVAMGAASGLWLPGSISGNTITLAQPWSGPALVAGTPVRDTGVGLDASNFVLNSEAISGDFTWNQYAGVFGGGVLTNGVDSNLKFRPGTAYVKPTIVSNQQGTTNNFISWRDVSLTEVPSHTTLADVMQQVVDLSVVTSGDQRYALPISSSQWSADLVRIDANQQYTITGRAVNVSDTNERPLDFASLDVDRKFIYPIHVTKYANAIDTAMAAALSPGDTSVLIQNASGWSNDVGEPADTRSLAWYGYTDSTGHTYADYTYTRNVAYDFDNGLWAPGGITYDVSAGAYRILLRNPWSGPTIPAGSAIRNAASGNTFNLPAVALNADTLGKRVEYSANIGGGTWQGGVRDENLFRPGTAFIEPLYSGTIGDLVIGPAEDNIYGGPTDPTRLVVEPSAGRIPIDLNVLGKGAFGGAASVVVDSVALPQYGTATILAGAGPGGRAVIHYSVPASFVGTDIVMYTLRNTATNETQTSSVTINFLNGNVTLSGVGKLFDNSYDVLTGQPLMADGVAQFGVLTFDGAASSARLVSGPAHGTLSFNDDGTFTYTSTVGFVGTDTFRYEADLAGQSASGVASINVFGTSESLALNRLRDVGLAVLNYNSSVKRFPVGTTTAANFDANGNPYLSWRVYILPYLGYSDLFNEFHLDEPWDSPNNLPLASQMPDIFRSVGDPATSTATRIHIISGEGAPYYWRRSTGLLIGPRSSDFSDGASNTLLAVETGADRAIVWTRPDPVTFDAGNPLASLGTIVSNYFNAVMADGSTISLPTSIDPATLTSLVTVSGGEVMDAATIRREYAQANGGDAAVQSYGAESRRYEY